MIYKGSTVGEKRPKQKRTCRIQAQITASEYQRLQALAERQSMSISAFVRAQAIYRELPCRITPTARKTYVALGRIQSNLTQLNQWLHCAEPQIGKLPCDRLALITRLQSQLAALEKRTRQIQQDLIDLPEPSQGELTIQP